MTPSNELINEWLKAAEAAPGPRFLTFATLAAAWGAEQEREACVEAVKAVANAEETDEMAYRALMEVVEAIRKRGEVKP